VASLLLLAVTLYAAEGPGEFLQDLCDHRYGPEGALFWSETHAPGEDGIPLDPDSLAPRLAQLRDLSVEPGERTLFEETEDGYLIEYGESSWTWTGADGRLQRAEGLTGILWHDGGYYWMEVPVLISGSAGLGPRERMLAGLLFTGMILGLGVMAMIWARRRGPSGR
jgi:hypothetical protein